VDIIDALNEREWKGARALIEGAVSAGTPLHSETLLLIAEKLDPDEREPPKRPRGSPGSTLEQDFEMIAIGLEAEQAVKDDKGKVRADDVLEGVAEQYGLSRKTVEKYRKIAKRLKKDLDLAEIPRPRAEARPKPEKPVRRGKSKLPWMRYRTEGVKKWLAGDIPRKFILDGVSYEATEIQNTTGAIAISYQDSKGCPQSTNLADVRLVLPRPEEDDG
jgi:hypothetical protein